TQIHYNPAESFHRELIQTTYKRLTHNKRGCPDEGGHWTTVGFRGRDPSTDLNDSHGIFSLLQVLHFLESQPSLVNKLYRLSLALDTGWPFMCVSIDFTKV
ncbi:unnamed protein product, partial [Choristocarpus tenellus]